MPVMGRRREVPNEARPLEPCPDRAIRSFAIQTLVDDRVPEPATESSRRPRTAMFDNGLTLFLEYTHGGPAPP